MAHDDDVAARIATLESQLAAIQGELSVLKREITEPPEATSRREVFKKLAIAGAGAAVGAVALGKPAAAADGDPVAAGETTTVQSQTTLHYDSATPPNGILNVFDDPAGVVASGYPAAITGASYGRVAHGVVGASNKTGGYGVIGGSDTGTGVLARGGVRANLELVAEGLPGPQRPGEHKAGEIVCDRSANLWLCTFPGDPGLWYKLGGRAGGTRLHGVGPVRVYDSRKYPDDTGRITGGEERLVGIGVWPGSQQPFPVVPDHVQAVVSLTLDATQGSGYLALLAPDDHYLFHSNINWYADGQIIAVTTIAGVGEGASVWVKAGGPGSTHFTIDVLGYFD